MTSQAVTYPLATRVGSLALLGLLCWASQSVAQESSLLHQSPQRAAQMHSQAAYGSAASGYRDRSNVRPAGAPAATLESPASDKAVLQQGVYPEATSATRPARTAPPPPHSSLSEVSWMYSPGTPPRQFRLNDIVTIRVDEIAQASAEGAAENRKNSLYDAVLKDWISLSGGFLKPSPQSDGDPRVNGQLNSLYRSDASIESRESLTFNIAARIVDIRPNGHLVVEANKTIWVNDNAFETSLTGICRADDIGPDNVLLSRDLLDPQIRKSERGSMRDGYRRGWLQRWLEEFQLF